MKNSLYLPNRLNLFITFGIFALLGLGIFNSFYVFGLGDPLNVKINEIKESAEPAILNLIAIESSCSECFDISPLLSLVKSSNVKIASEVSFSSESLEAKDLIDKYNILRLPTIILQGEVGKTSIQNFKLIEDTLVFEGVTPPYVDASSLEVVGDVSAIMVEDPSCELCSNFDVVITGLKQSGIFIKDEKKVEYSTIEGSELIASYNLSKVPALLLSDDINVYEGLAQSLQQSGLQPVNGYYVIEGSAPYVEIETGNLRGLVNLIMLEDNTCTECYDVGLHRQILSNNLGLEILEEEIIDIGSSIGEELISKYTIEKIPTAIVSGDLEAYPNFDQIWASVGTIEEDGSYVFRQLELLGAVVYRNLITGEIVVPTENPQV
tara:strand:- start:1591 stop:2727 length:1137 start_codon:yes stop_codon:yes gene_type:complete